MITRQQIRNILRPWIRFLKFRILHVDDSPRNLAAGVAIGLLIAWLPLIGLQMLIALAAAIIFKANKFLAVTFVWVSNVFTFGIIYFPNYLLGKWILNLLGLQHTSTRAEAMELMHKLGSVSIFIDIWKPDFWQNIWRLLANIGLPLWIGSFIIAIVVGVISYIYTYRLIIWYRTKNPRRRYRKHM